MLRRIIHIDEGKCNGCGACATACHEGAIGMVDGKARLLRDDYCDGLGDCLPACSTGAITFTEREAAAYDEKAVRESRRRVGTSGEVGRELEVKPADEIGAGTKPTDEIEAGAKPATEAAPTPFHRGCPGSMMRTMNRESAADADSEIASPVTSPATQSAARSQLGQWPCQIKLVPTNAPYFDGAKLLIAADCTAYAYARMHDEFMRGKITLIGCPKLDGIDYSEKLTEIIEGNDIQSVTIVRMEVPCCGGLEMAAKNALRASGKFIPWQVVTISIDGRIL